MLAYPAGRLQSGRCRHGRRGASLKYRLCFAVVIFFLTAGLFVEGVPLPSQRVFAAGTGSAGAARPSAEVPTGHWAYRDLDVLARADLLTGVVVGGFVGATLTRSEVAWMVEGVLEFISGRPRATQMVAAAATGSQGRRDLDALLDEAVGAYNKRREVKPLDDLVKGALTRLTVEFWPEMQAEMNTSHPEPVRPGTARFQDLDAMVRSLAKSSLSPVRAEKRDSVAPPGIDDPEARQRLKEWWPSDTAILGKVPGTGDAKDTMEPVDPVDPVDLGGGATVDADYFRVPRENTPFLLDERRYEEEDAIGRGLALLSGRVALAPGVDVFGKYLTRLITADAGAVNLGANVRLGNVQIDARYRDYGKGLPALPGVAKTSPGSDVNVSVKVGDFRVHTSLAGTGTGAGTGGGTGQDGTSTKRSAALGLEYTFGTAVTVNAGYRLVDLDAIGAGATGGASNSGGIGVGVNLHDRAKVTAQVDFGGPIVNGPAGIFTHREAQAGLEIQLPWNTTLMADYALSGGEGEPWRSNAAIGLGYSVSQRAAFLLGYRMIDFGDGQVDTADHPVNVATAELKIRF